MTVGQWMTNKGVTALGAGAWATEPAGSIQMGLLVTTQPAAADTQAEVQQMNYVADLTVTAGAIECIATNYARIALTRLAVAEDDVNNRANYSVGATPVFPSLGGTVNQLVIGHFIFAEGGGSDLTRPLWVVRWYALVDSWTTTGSDFIVSMSDTFQLAAA